jgi:DNA-binding NarL/FixJ family response regulator
MTIGDITYKVHLDGYNLTPAFKGESEWPRHEFFYWTDDGNCAALRYNNCKISFLKQEAHGLDVWRQPFVELRAPLICNLRMDPLERAEYEGMDYDHWYVDHVFVGLELQEALAQAEESLPVVFLTAHGDISSSVRAMKRGAVDFLTKPVRGELLDALQRALTRGAAAQGMQRQKREWGARYEGLTPRERELFALVVRGLVNKQIADVLGICERTVKAHRGQVMHKDGSAIAGRVGASG